MLKNKYCYLCLSNKNRTINIYKTDLQYIYENLADLKIRGNECWMCYICHTRLRQCHRLRQLAVQTRGLVDDLCEKQINTFGTFGTLLELSIHNETMISVSLPSSCIKQEPDVKTEPNDDDGIEQGEIQEYANNEAKDTVFFIEFEDPMLVSGAGCTQNFSNVGVNDSWQESKGLELKMAGLSQSHTDAHQSLATHTITENHFMDWGEQTAALCAYEQSTENTEIQQEIDENIGDTVTPLNIERVPQQNSEIPDIVNRDEFTIELKKYYSGHNKNSKKFEWTSNRIENVIKLLEENSTLRAEGRKQTNQHYYHARKYDVVNIGGQKILITKRKDISEPVIQIIPTDDYYEKILEAHIATGHGRRDKIIHALKDKYMVPIFAITIFLNMCKTCLSKKSLSKREIVVKPIMAEDFNQIGQIDIVDLQTSPDEEYKWLLQYQDLLTKFCFLRPLKSERAKEVAIETLKIFLEVGCPHILRIDNEPNFSASVLKEIVSWWPACKIVNGGYPQSQGSMECPNEDVKNMIQAWMIDNKSTNWSIGCYFVQFQKNSSYNPTIARTPYKAMFGQDPNLGLSSTYLSQNIISKVENEEDIEIFFEEVNKNKEQNSETNQKEELENVNKINSSTMVGQNIKQEETTTASHETIILEHINTDNNPQQLPELHKNLPTVSNAIINKPDNKQEKISFGSTHSLNSSKLCVNEYNILQESTQSHTSQSHQIHLKRAADKMISTSSKKYKDNISTGSTVLVEVPKFDMGPLDNRNPIRKVLMKNNELYKVGIIKDWMPRNSVLSCPNAELLRGIPEVTSPLTVASMSSLFSGQGIKQCNCKIIKNGQCISNKCNCKKANVPCNSRCHNSLTCNNK